MDILVSMMNKPEMDTPPKFLQCAARWLIEEEHFLQRKMMIKSDKEQMDHMAVQESHHVYIVKCVDGSLYTGYATNVEQRVASAQSSDLFGLDQMRFTRNPIIGTHTSLQFVSAQESIRLRNIALAMNPLWLNGVEPGTFGG